MTRLILLALLAITPCFPAYAQSSGGESQLYDPTFTGQGGNKAAERIHEMKRESLKDKGFISPQAIQISIVHYPFMEQSQYGIQMAVPDLVSGCFTLSPLEYEANFVDPYFLDIKVKKYRRVAPEGPLAFKKCNSKNQMSTALMVLDKQDLLKRGTEEIRFSGDAGSDTYKILISEDHLELIPESMLVFKAQSLGGPLKDRIIHSFASGKMITLQVPMAQAGEDLSNEIIAFARTRALTPATPTQPAAWGGNGRAMYYFYDDNGHILEKIGENGYAELGKITVNRPYDGPEGRSQIPVELSVFVTRPGTQL